MTSHSGAYASISRSLYRHGYMFSTAKRTSVSSAIRQMPVTKSRAYWRCQRKGGWTTTVEAPSRSAAAWARWSLTQGSVDQTRWVMSRQGAWTARIGTWW
ncbi:hypothetical protein GCM10018784_45020 [Streptomyces hydrogenans]|nr:hypothetical protein GCM10018784_45020 [Streptomyces hydrogenans]